MICKNCGTVCEDNVMYCTNCGTSLQQEGQYQQNEPFTMPNYGNYNYNAYNPPVQENKPVSMGTYVGWTLLAYALGPISFIISIVFACMTENRNRANFFRAQLVMWSITIVLSIIVFAVFAVIGFSFLEYADAPIVDAYEYYYYDEFLNLASHLKF